MHVYAQFSILRQLKFQKKSSSISRTSRGHMTSDQKIKL